MLESVGSFISAIKSTGPRIYAAALVATLLLIFLPDNIIAEMGLTQIKQAYRAEIGAILIGSASLLTVHVAFGFGRFTGRLWRSWRFQRDARMTLRELTEEEKEFLRPFVFGGVNTKHASLADGIANGLEAKNIIYRASSVSLPGTPGMLFPWKSATHCAQASQQ